jgi:hypothetical protein
MQEQGVMSGAGELRLGRDPVTVAPLTGQRKVAAASLPYVKFALIGATGVVPRALGDERGVWPIKLVVTTDVADSLRQARRHTIYGLDVHFEAWTDAPRDVAQNLKQRFDGALTQADRLLSDTAALFDCPPELALQGLAKLCQEMRVILYDNSWYDAQVTLRATRNARVLGGRR